ncbi:N-acetylglucosamine-6-phosphate deacetylase [Arcticibacter eurypsychrophilus]|uniref:N-acetylglucosamine-6-phosphate deacetylase n=1 Tax=Arcticibacter eurypsychrophilus TaxID=1434752 RepID=UPI00084DD6BF|nr:N-acetylglucosamine-6-phosphate deacetylase [Arcticibacter eurypsychrophilus]
MVKIVTNGLLYTGEEVLTHHAVVIQKDQIIDIIPEYEIPANAELIDCKGSFIVPGFIDLQIYGAGGYLFSGNLTAEALKAIADDLVKKGTTGFVITLATNSIDVFLEAIRLVRDNPHPALLGIHLEGPYINPAKRGAHIEQYIKVPQRKEIEALLKEAAGVLKIMTLAPEVTDPVLIKLLIDNGVIVSAGHSIATFQQATDGFAQGISCTTHLFNAMSPFHHRDTGLPGATFQSKTVMASMVADGIHIDYQALMISKKLLQERMFLITDAVEECHEGPYQHMKQGDHFTMPDGTLSGSALTLLKAVENCVNHADIPLDEALRMASTYPAQILNKTDVGKIKIGYKADLVVFNSEYQVEKVWLNGLIQ